MTPSFNNPEARQFSPIDLLSERDVDQYLSEHQHEETWKDVLHARRWGLNNVLPYFENECARLSGKPNGELRRARELTAYLDRDPRTSAHFHETKDQIILDLQRFRDQNLSLLNDENRSHEAQEREIAEGNAEAWNEDIAEFKDLGNVENVLSRVEKLTEKYNSFIDADGARVDRTPVAERPALEERIKRNTAKRDSLRQTRANLLREYFKDGSLH